MNEKMKKKIENFFDLENSIKSDISSKIKNYYKAKNIKIGNIQIGDNRFYITINGISFNSSYNIDLSFDFLDYPHKELSKKDKFKLDFAYKEISEKDKNHIKFLKNKIKEIKRKMNE